MMMRVTQPRPIDYESPPRGDESRLSDLLTWVILVLMIFGIVIVPTAIVTLVAISTFL